MIKDRTFKELFSLPGFRANAQLKGKFGAPKCRIVVLSREKKRLYALGVG